MTAPISFHLPESQDPVEIIQMVHKLLASGKTYAALIHCERFLMSIEHARHINDLIQQHHDELANYRGEGL